MNIEKLIEINIKELNITDDFELYILTLCEAINDLFRINALINVEDNSLKLFNFKISIAILREAYKLILDRNKYCEYNKLSNINIINICIDELNKITNGESENNIIFKVYKPLRDITFHYHIKKDKEEDYKKGILISKNNYISSIGIINDYQITNFLYYFYCDEIYLEKFKNQFQTYYNNEMSLQEIIILTANISTSLLNVLRMIVEAFLYDYFDINENKIIRKKI